MLFHDSSKYLCPCGNPHTRAAKDSFSSIIPRNLHKLPDLYFCPKCHSAKCSNCCDVTVVSKFCANCMSDYTDSPGMTRCTKNCFECPLCSSPLSVSIHDESKTKSTGKSFNFICVHCTYTYTTKSIKKPAPLSTILKAEQPSYFQDLQDKYNMSHKLLVLKNTQKPKLTTDALSKMKQMDINPSNSDNLDEAEKLALKLGDFCPQPVDIDADFIRKSPVTVPKSAHLTAKTAYSCNTCETRLLSPVPNPRSMKYLEKELAIDVMPLVTASVCSSADPNQEILVLGSDTSCVLSIVNPLLHSMSVTVSTLEHIPSEISGTHFDLSLSLPVMKATIPARREKANVLDSIPSVYLTNSTQESRAESLTRTIRREGLRRTTDSEEPLIESGSNWVSLPFNVTLLEKHRKAVETADESDVNSPKEKIYKLDLPFYITFETRVPSSWTYRSKKGLKFGFWVVCSVS